MQLVRCESYDPQGNIVPLLFAVHQLVSITKDVNIVLTLTNGKHTLTSKGYREMLDALGIQDITARIMFDDPEIN